MIEASHSGTSGLTSRTGRGASSQTRRSTAIDGLGPEGGRPVAHRVQHAAQAEQIGAGVDRLAAGLLGRHVLRRAGDEPLCVRLASSAARARPKSVILTRSTPFSSRMLAGLMSRWISPCAWAAASPLASACRSAEPRRPPAGRRGRSAPAATGRRRSGMTRYGSPFVRVDGVDGDDVVVADGGRRPRLAGEPQPRGGAGGQVRREDLDATNRCRAGSNALSTTPIPPRPMTSTTCTGRAGRAPRPRHTGRGTHIPARSSSGRPAARSIVGRRLGWQTGGGRPTSGPRRRVASSRFWQTAQLSRCAIISARSPSVSVVVEKPANAVGPAVVRHGKPCVILLDRD